MDRTHWYIDQHKGGWWRCCKVCMTTHRKRRYVAVEVALRKRHKWFDDILKAEEQADG